MSLIGRSKRRPSDEGSVHDLAVEAGPDAPAYLTPAEALTEMLASRDLIVLRAQILVKDALGKLDEAWRRHRGRSMEALGEHTAGSVSHLLGGYLRELSGPGESPAYAEAVDAAVTAAATVGGRRLTELPLPVTRWSLQEFFTPSRATSRFEDVGDEMAVAAVDAFVEALRHAVQGEGGPTADHA